MTVDAVLGLVVHRLPLLDATCVRLREGYSRPLVDALHDGDMVTHHVVVRDVEKALFTDLFTGVHGLFHAGELKLDGPSTLGVAVFSSDRLTAQTEQNRLHAGKGAQLLSQIPVCPDQ